MVKFMEHYHEERNHQRLENTLIRPCADCAADEGQFFCRQRVGGILNYYYRQVP